LYDIFFGAVSVHNIEVIEIGTAKFERMQLRPFLRYYSGHTTGAPNDVTVVLQTVAA